MDQQLEQDIETLQGCIVKERWSENVGADGIEGGASDAQALARCLLLLRRLSVSRRDQIKCRHQMRPTVEGSRSRRYGWVKECSKCGLKVKAQKER